MKIEEDPCVICNTSVKQSLYANNEVQYVMCDTCTLVSLHPRPTDEEYREFYRDTYQKERHKVTNYEEAVARLERKESVERRRKYLTDLKPYLSHETRVLEIGSSYGALLKLIRDTYGSDVTGIEISDLAAHVAKNYYDIPTFNQTFAEYSKERHGDTFDMIIMTHVLEHILNPKQTLLNVKNLLNEGGVLFIAVPNIARPFEPLDRFFHFEHVYYFSPLTLMQLFKNCGLKILYWNTKSLDIRVAVVKETDERPEIDISTFINLYSGKRIRSILKRQEYKYALLRIFKRAVEIIFPPRILIPIRQFVVTLLRKLHIIDV